MYGYIMTHTIEEIREAKAVLCMEIAEKLGEFERDYGVTIEDMRYGHGEVKTNDAFGVVVYTKPQFIFDVKL